MLELVAQGVAPEHCARLVVQPGMRLVVGRAPDADWALPWDAHISRRHAQIEVLDQQLSVRRHPAARNPIFFAGEAVEACVVPLGRQFVLGSTLIQFEEAPSEIAAETPVAERAFSPQQLQTVRYQDPENRLEVLTHLPEVIAGAQSDAELHERLARLLLRGVLHAETAAIVSCGPDDAVTTRQWSRRLETAGEPRPSRRLVCAALLQRRTSVLHVWSAGETADDVVEPTLGSEFDWAFCTPVAGLADEPTGLYLAGRMGRAVVPGLTLSESAQLEADVKFTELVAEIIAAVLMSRRLERQRAGLRQFFAPPILAALGDELDTTLLEPCECDATVLFCDLRGFSRRAEHEADRLLALLDRVSGALGVMTRQILAHGGVTADFQGDAALGFWGWPFPSPDAAVQACRAALGIRAEFQRAAAQPEHPLADFSMGIGIAHGRAVAGKIGTSEQVKVTVFGPVVNLAHRLESMTKTLRAPILIDEATAAIVRARMPAADGRVRMLARVLPYGLATPVLVHELVPPVADQPELTDAHLEQFEKGVAHFLAGDWESAYRALHGMPLGDHVPDFLLHQITQSGRTAPARWDGVIRLPGK